MKKKHVSEFVKKMRGLSARIVKVMLWNSTENGTYIKEKHGELVRERR